MARKRVFRIVFQNQGKVYEIFASQVVQGDLYGFVEVSGILFGEKSTLLVDPGEEHLKHEFNGVQKTFIPYHSVIRIDQVEKEGNAKVIHLAGPDDGAETRRPLPPPGSGPTRM